jgi:hypothetical protein
MAEDRYLRLATLDLQPTTRVPTTLHDQRHSRGAPTLRLLPAVRREEEGPLLAPSSEYTLLYGASDPLPLSACCAQAHSNAANMTGAQLGRSLLRGCMGYGRNEIPTTTTTTTTTTTKTTTTTTTTTRHGVAHTLPLRSITRARTCPGCVVRQDGSSSCGGWYEGWSCGGGRGGRAPVGPGIHTRSYGW